MRNLKLFPLLLTLTLTLTGCGDLGKNQKVENQMKPVTPGQDCELDIDNISYILERNIKSTLLCLGNKLEAFMDYEQLGAGERLSRVALQNYLVTTRPDISPRTRKIIDTIFWLNHIISGESEDFITRSSVRKIVKLGTVFNGEAATHYNRIFKSEASATLERHQLDRRSVTEATWRIQAAFTDLYEPWREGRVDSISIVKLLESFIAEENVETLNKIKGVLFAKKILLGGESDILTHVEMGRLFSNLPRIMGLLLDGVRYKHLELDQLANLKLLNDDLFALSEIVYDPSLGNRDKEKLFHVDEAIDGIQAFMDEKDSLTKFRALFHEGMRILTQRPPESNDFTGELSLADYWITGEDIEKIFNHGFNVLGKGLAFHKMYQNPALTELLKSPVSLNLKFEDYQQYFPGQEDQLKDFVRIANNYRFQRGSFDVAYYSTDYHRNVNAFFETAAYEYVIRLGFRFYGSSLSMSKEQIVALLKKFENELIETGIMLPRRAPNTAETIALLGSLFQYQSDDNKVLDVNEATEFAISLVTAMEAKKKLYAFFEDEGCEKDPFDRIDPLCFRQKFYKGLCQNYRSYFPRLFEFLGMDATLGCNTNFLNDHNNAYLDSSIKAARFCNVFPDNGEEIHYSDGDIMSILLAMMHIETTIIRWDQNLNNTMDFDEVMKSYEIYAPAIQGMLPKLPAILDKPAIKEKLAKLVFKYLVKYEETPVTKWPEVLTLIKRLLSFNLKAPAHRKTIASILWIVSEESKKKSIAAGEPQFDCKWLRDPDNIPRD